MVIKYKDEDLTDEEYKDAILQNDVLEQNLKIQEFNLNIFEEQIKKRIPQRQFEVDLQKNLLKMKEVIELTKNNLKVYQRQVRTKKKEVPVSYEKDEVCEQVTEEPVKN